MKTIDLIILITPVALSAAPKTGEMNGMAWYIAGALIAILLLGYLLYSLVKPEKF